jgi:AcrR family transcriptional regulator
MAAGAENQLNLAARRERGRARLGPFGDSARGRVLAAMVEVVAHGGYREATVDRVLDRADVGWQEFTRMFDGLDACFLETLEAGLACSVALAEEAVDAVGERADIDDAVGAALSAVLEGAAANRNLTRLCLVEAPALGAAASERRQAGMQRFVELLERRLDSSRTDKREAPPRLAAEMVVGGMYEVVERKARADEIEDLPALADELEQLWLPTLRAS